jgi:hypothetical protein
MTEFKAGDLVRVYYSVPVGLQKLVKQIYNPAYGDQPKTVGYYIAKIVSVEVSRLCVINTANSIKHYVHPKQCRYASQAKA